MLHERRSKIVNMISADRMVKVSELTKLFDVSIETIRRDLEYLEEKGYLTRVYGGAVAKSMFNLEPEYAAREVKNLAEKSAIGQAAAALINEGDTVYVDVGTTTLEFAKALKGTKNVTIITNAMKIAMTLADDSNIHVILLGGDTRRGEFSTSGFLAESNIRNFNFNTAVIGIGGLTIDNGISDYHINEANLRRHIIERAQKVIGLSDYSKIGITTMNRICPVESMTTLVTDDKAPSKFISDLKARGIEVIVAQTKTE